MQHLRSCFISNTRIEAIQDGGWQLAMPFSELLAAWLSISCADIFCWEAHEKCLSLKSVTKPENTQFCQRWTRATATRTIGIQWMDFLVPELPESLGAAHGIDPDTWRHILPVTYPRPCWECWKCFILLRSDRCDFPLGRSFWKSGKTSRGLWISKPDDCR